MFVPFLLIHFPHDVTAPSGPGPPHYRGFTITLKYITVDRIPLDVWLAQRRNLNLTTHDTLKRQALLPSMVFEPAVPVNERP